MGLSIPRKLSVGPLWSPSASVVEDNVQITLNASLVQCLNHIRGFIDWAK